jgi:hypothetical protein
VDADKQREASVYRDYAQQFRRSAELASDPGTVQIFWRLAKIFEADADKLDPQGGSQSIALS